MLCKEMSSHWMEIVDVIAKQSTCASGRSVGAIIVIDDRLIVSGYNGVPVGYPKTKVCERREKKIQSGEGLHLCVCVHAESNCIAYAARNGIKLYDGILYCTTEPCTSCMSLIANAGIRKVIFKENYPNTQCKHIANYARIEVIQYND